MLTGIACLGIYRRTRSPSLSGSSLLSRLLVSAAVLQAMADKGLKKAGGGG